MNLLSILLSIQRKEEIHVCKSRVSCIVQFMYPINNCSQTVIVLTVKYSYLTQMTTIIRFYMSDE